MYIFYYKTADVHKNRIEIIRMMRCIGMSRQQLKRFVRLEALNWCKTAIPVGLVLGTVITWAL